MTATAILGLPIGSDSPLFLAVLAVHVPAGLLAVITGAGAALTRKGSPRHVTAGRGYLWAVRVVAVTALVLTGLRWPHDLHLAVLGVTSLAAATLGQRARRRHPAGHPTGDRAHITAMSVSYIALLTAFYVDNGPHLPLWRHLPVLVFWTAPALIGSVPLIRALNRAHPAR